MGEKWWRRKRRFDSWLGDFLEGPDRMEKIMDNMIRQAFGSPSEREKARRRYIQEFGGFHLPNASGSQMNEEYKPLIDVFVNETSIVIVAELPGIDKESIEVDAIEDKVTITVDMSRRKYCREFTLPAKVDPKSSTASYKNGVLEVSLKKLVRDKLLAK